jgi:hypothetical protein
MMPIGVFHTGISNNSPSAETLAGQILYTIIRDGYNLISHFRTPVARLVRGLEGVRCTVQSSLFYHSTGVSANQGTGV